MTGERFDFRTVLGPQEEQQPTPTPITPPPQAVDLSERTDIEVLQESQRQQQNKPIPQEGPVRLDPENPAFFNPPAEEKVQRPAFKLSEDEEARIAETHLDLVSRGGMDNYGPLWALSEATGYSVDLLKTFQPSVIERMMERPDVTKLLERGQNTRRVIAENLQAAAALRGDLPLHVANEEAFRRLGYRVTAPPFLPEVTRIDRDDEPVSFAGGLRNMLIRGSSDRASLIEAGAAFRATAQRLQDIDKDATDIMGDAISQSFEAAEIGPQGDGLVTTLLGGIVDGGYRVVNSMFADEADRERIHQEAVALLHEIDRIQQRGQTGRNRMSDIAQTGAEYLKPPEGSGPLETMVYMANAIADHPLEVGAFLTEVIGQEVPTIGLSVAASRFSPAVGSAIMVAAGGATEYTQLPFSHMQEEFGVDLRTEEGAKQFLASPEMQTELERYSVARGLPISAGAAASLLLARFKIGNAGTNVLFQGSQQAVTGTGSELAAQYASVGEADWYEAYIEGLAEVPTVAVDGFIAGAEAARRKADEKKLKDWLETGREVQGNLGALDAGTTQVAAETIARQLADQGITALYVNGEAIHTLYQDDPSIAETLGVTEEQAAAAAADGTDVAITPDVYIRHILGADGFSQLMEHTKVDPDGVTDAELKAFKENEEDIAAMLDERTQKIMERNGVTEASAKLMLEDIEYIRQEVTTMLQETRAYLDDQIELFAGLTAQRYAARAIRASRVEQRQITAGELFLEDNLQISNLPPSVDARVLEQPLSKDEAGRQVGDFDPDIAARFDDAKQVSVDEAVFDSDERSFWIAPDGTIRTSDEEGTHAKLVRQISPQHAEGVQGADQVSDRFQDLTGAVRFVIESDEAGPRTLLMKMHNYQLNNEQRRAIRELAMAIDDIRSDDLGKVYAERLDDDGVTMSEELSIAETVADIRAARAGAGEYFNQSVDLRTGSELISIDGKKTLDVARALEARTRAKHGTIARDDRSAEASAKIAEWIIDEVLFELRDGNETKSGVGWYSWKFQQALDEFGKKHAVLIDEAAAADSVFKTTENARTFLTSLIAITSDGQKVAQNFKFADRLFTEYVETGTIDSSKTTFGADRATSMRINVENILKLTAGGKFENLRDTLLQEDTVTNLKKLAKEEGEEFSANYPAVKELPYAALVFGPKLGAFYANLMGSHGYLTMDRWWSRTFNRYRGVLLSAPTRQGLDRVKELVIKDRRLNTPAEEITDDEVISYAAEYAKAYEAKGFKNGTELEKAANTVWKAANQTNDTPFNTSDRGFMIDTVARAQEKLKKQYRKDVSVADIQAILWYYEKRLYSELGARGTADISYADTAKEVISGRDTGSTDTIDGPDGQPIEVREGTAADAGRSQPTGDGAGRDEGGAAAALEGAPAVDGASGPDPRLTAVAEAYASAAGIPFTRQQEYVQVDADRAARIAEAYEAMEHAPGDPDVREAYENLINQTRAQYDALIEAGYTFTFFDDDTDPYGGNPWNAMRDLRNNQTMAVYSTLAGYGSGVSDLDVSDNPMLADTGIVWKDQAGNDVPVLANDLFRAVHDAFGHGLEGAGFRARGEENAWQAHSRLFTGSALGAITSETRGQNSWLNFGPHGETNRTAALEDTVFADQKTGLMPEWTWQEGALPLEQRGRRGAKGAFTPSSSYTDQDGNPANLISIFEKADLSTFLHESGHFWLEQLRDDAGRFGDEFAKDWSTVISWWKDNADAVRAEAMDRARRDGDKDAVAKLAKMSDAAVRAHIGGGDLTGKGHTRYLSTAMHEQFARGTEDYFRNGQAPSLDLADAFMRFAAWITSIYRRLSKLIGRDALDVQFSPEVKAVLDRMLASDEQMEIAASLYEMKPLFTDAKQMGLSQAEFAAYNKATADRRNRLKAQNIRRNMQRLERERADWWLEQREELRKDTEEEVSQERGYRLLWALAANGRANGGTVPAGERFARMDASQLSRLVGKDLVARLPKVDGVAIYTTKAKEDASSPGAVAQAYGYGDVEEMVDDLVTLRPFEARVEDVLDLKMEQLHGKLDDGTARIAEDTLHEGNTMAAHLYAELKALQTTEELMKPGVLKAYAAQKIAETTLRDISPHRYRVAERKYARQAGVALRKGDRAGAYKAQFRRLLNHHMASQAQAYRDKTANQRRYLAQFMNPKRKFRTLDADFVTHIRDLLANKDFGVKASPRRSPEAAQKLEDKLREQYSLMGLDTALLDRRVHWRDLTAGEWNALVDQIKQIEKQARNFKRVLVGEEKRDRAEVIAMLRAKLAGRKTSLAANEAGSALNDRDARVFSPIAALDAALLKTEFLLENLDDGEPTGIWHQALFQPFADAEARRNDLMQDVVKMIHAEQQNMGVTWRRNMGSKVKDVPIAKEGEVWRRGNLIMLALNTGNESNMQKLIEGERQVGRDMTEQSVKATLDLLTREEWHFVQRIWDHAEGLWPEVDALYREEYGRSPGRVARREVETKYGTFSGGYFPMMYDPRRSQKGRNVAEQDAIAAFNSEANRASVNSSMTKERTSFAAPVNLDITHLTRGFEKTAHFITHYKPVQNARRILMDDDLQSDLRATVGPQYADALDKWLGSVAANGMDLPPVNALERVGEMMIRNTTVAVLGLSYSTLVAQTFGLTTTIDRLMADTTYGPIQAGIVTADLARGLANAFNQKHVDWVMKESGMMRHRITSQDLELRKTLRSLEGKKGVLARAQQGSMLAIAHVQFRSVDLPTWTAAYNRALRANAPHKEAVNYADRVVRITQSAAGQKDLAAVQRIKGLARAFAMFYSFFSVLYGITRQITGEVSGNPKTWIRAAARIFVVITVQEMLMALVKEELPLGDDDDEGEPTGPLDYAKFAAERTFMGVTSTVPLLRDIVSGAMGDYGYSGSPASMFGESFVQALQAAGDQVDYWASDGWEGEEPDLSDWKAIINTFGVMTGTPAIQANRTLSAIDGLWFEEDPDANYYDLLNGFNKNDEGDSL